MPSEGWTHRVGDPPADLSLHVPTPGYRRILHSIRFAVADKEDARPESLLIAMELRAHASYSRLDCPIRYWRTAAGQEMDFVLGDGEVAVEVKASALVREQQFRGLRVGGITRCPCLDESRCGCVTYSSIVRHGDKAARRLHLEVPF